LIITCLLKETGWEGTNGVLSLLEKRERSRTAFLARKDLVIMTNLWDRGGKGSCKSLRSGDVGDVKRGRLLLHYNYES